MLGGKEVAAGTLIMPPAGAPNGSTLEKRFQYLKWLGIFVAYICTGGIAGPQTIFLGI